MPELSIARLDPADSESWDNFVQGAPGGTFFHLSGWRTVIENVFGHKTYYLTASRNGAIEGVLPLTHVRSMLFGNSLISNAFCVEGGVVASTDDARQSLLNEAVRIGRSLNVDCVELRSSDAGREGWVRREGLYVGFRRALDPDPEVNMKAIPRKQRAMVRKGIAAGLVSECDTDAGRLHDVYAQSVHHLGTPVFPKRYFQALKDQFGDTCDIVTILNGNEPVASVMNFYFRDEVLPYYGGGTTKARELAANDFMYWEVMRRATLRGCRTFDFGRSKIGTGAYNFKRYWGFEPTPLAYEFFPVAKQELPENNPLNPKFRLFVSAWQKMPLSLTKIIGPMIVRSIG
jgi:FemAB-related protein (PEP-CTERM system-associated)